MVSATIVTPRNAVEHLLNECIDILAIEDFIVHKKKKVVKKRKNNRGEKLHFY